MTVSRVHSPSTSVYYRPPVAMCGDLWAFFKPEPKLKPFYLLSPSRCVTLLLQQSVGQFTQVGKVCTQP